jgi:hypothetical protein
MSGLTYTLAVLYWIATALYGTLSSQAFVQEQFLAPRLVEPLAFFADWHAAIGVVVLAAWGAPRWRRPGRGPALRTAATALVWLVFLTLLAVAVPLAGLRSTGAALLVVAIGVGSTALAAACERRPLSGTTPVSAGGDRSRADLAVCLLTAIGVTVAHSAALVWLDGASAPLAVDAMQSLRLHLLLAGGAFLVLTAIRAAAALARSRTAVEVVLTIATLGAALAWLVFTVGLASISIRGPVAAAIAVGIGASIAAAVGARGTLGDDSGPDGVAVVLGALAPRVARQWWGFAVVLAGVTVLAALVSTASRAGDWNFVILRTGAAAIWLLTLAAALVLGRRFPAGGAAPSFALVALLLGGHLVLETSVARLEASSIRNPSAKWLAEALQRRSPPDGGESLVALLHSQTNIPRETYVAPVDIALAPLENGSAADRPHVFVFVIDSLRRDYLSPYNPAVAFTPAIDRLARDSLVFRNAFTQYGATGLSVPSLWVGGPILHKQYVTPFAPMNALAKLLAHEQYAQWIGMDNILNVILPPDSARVPLDRGVAVKDVRLCRTLGEVRARLADRAATEPPVFVYSLPQDLHVSAVAREGSRALDEGDYAGFHAPMASRVRRLDACLGAFLEDLEARGLYENSVIVLTSDHGDSLGEEGRMGHAYSLHPEVVRVPLIVHVPPRLRRAWRWNEARVAFTTDITPTLYRLLGHEPETPAPFFGEPLAHPPGQPLPAGRDRMIAASYGAVYGAILDGGARYYVFDAIAMRELAFDVGTGPDPGSPLALTPELRLRGQAVIGQTVEELRTFYGFNQTAE